ncbi:hypothetical protein GGX14DRAFT_446686 [Mycena pura]|uniref:Uncharacterized protein n=1 Tax=Mycena pura TaxID=153505 RepID=A0AAD6YBW5_9AGAR|nr:hypothetical protein GGX14DRAFT_446686 [Mycena pura]
MRFSVALPLLCAAVGPSFVRAVDDRLLYTIPTGDDMVGFTVDFGNACAKWQPALNAGLTFGDFLVEPGDFSGKNPDTEAKIVCGWSGGMTFTVDVAASLGATPTAD